MHKNKPFIYIFRLPFFLVFDNADTRKWLGSRDLTEWAAIEIIEQILRVLIKPSSDETSGRFGWIMPAKWGINAKNKNFSTLYLLFEVARLCI